MAEHMVSDAPATVLGPRLAAGVVAMVRARAGIRLDYLPGSLTLVDRIIDGMRRTDGSGAPAREVLLGFGAYTGQVLVGAAAAAWVDFGADQRAMFGQPFGVITPDGRVWNPLGKAVKRYENGAEDSLRLFCLSVAGRAAMRPPPDHGARGPRSGGAARSLGF
ncbi:hypothetical protein [Streptomyces sp. HPF1205]|uniref:hypothetical protein n=1 Tax=Streptomyces sp. HPF1205 TaxID=2873262 RepID=UPI001CECBBBB|nr:hypothetical protein [Streptomyces sp. HPF1205]